MARNDLSRIDRFAELLSQEVPVAAICERMGISMHAATGYLFRIRTGLGIPAHD